MYVFNTLEEAQAALAIVNADFGYPRVEENGYRADTWANIDQRIDGKFVFQEIGEYNWTKEEPQDDWFGGPQ